MDNIFSLNKVSSSKNLVQNIKSTIDFLKGKKTLVLGFSNRWQHPDKKKDVPKSEQIGRIIVSKVGPSAEYMDVFKLKIYPCEGNISSVNGNNCGVKKSVLKDKDKNPSGNHRCWASLNNKDDELWKVSKAIFDSDVVLFITPVRWGQACATYQKLIERLSWIENRHRTLGEENIIKGKAAGFICIGHNWNGKNVLDTQRQVLEFYGFDVNDAICWNYQWTQDVNDELLIDYKKDAEDFADKIVELTVKKTESE